MNLQTIFSNYYYYLSAKKYTNNNNNQNQSIKNNETIVIESKVTTMTTTTTRKKRIYKNNNNINICNYYHYYYYLLFFICNCNFLKFHKEFSFLGFVESKEMYYTNNNNNNRNRSTIYTSSSPLFSTTIPNRCPSPPCVCHVDSMNRKYVTCTSLGMTHIPIEKMDKETKVCMKSSKVLDFIFLLFFIFFRY